MDLWRVRPTGGDPERLTRHNNDVRFPAPIDNRTVLYVTKAEDGSGPYLYAVDVERRQSHRVSFGLEQYTSVNASADGRRVVASVSNPSASLFTVPILNDRVAEESDVKPFPVPNVRALVPRFGPEAVFYLSSLGGGDGLWRFAKGEAAEIWKGADGPLLEPPAVSTDGHQVAFNLRRRGRITLHVMNVEGGGIRPLTESLDVRDVGSWSADGQWIAIGGNDGKGAGLFKVPVAGGAPVRLTDKPGFKPVWSPDGRLIVYSGPVVGREQTVFGVSANGGAMPLPDIKVRFEGERYRFLPSGKGLVYMQGLQRQQDFWLLDLATQKSHLLTRLHNTAAMRTFDVSPDGKQIVFDRITENSDVVLIDLKK
jgi:Tol biopolymer transport system component